MRILSVEHVVDLIRHHGLERCLSELSEQLSTDFARWHEFTKVPRPAMHVPGGVIELMPICDATYYTFKYVNGHPKNPEHGKQTVMATGQLARVDNGQPLLFSEMTLLTALRTAATAALATDLMARQNSHILAIIGTGAQSEFQVQACARVRPITEVRYFDTDPVAMEKFANNMRGYGLRLVAATSARAAVEGADIVTVCTACKQHVDVIHSDWVRAGTHINALGGDCPGKTELQLELLKRSQVVVEYFDQSCTEGEIQRFSEQAAHDLVRGELFEFIAGQKQARPTSHEITIFDSVGIALEDYSALRWIYDLAERYEMGEQRNLIPTARDPKNLYGTLLTTERQKVASP